MSARTKAPRSGSRLKAAAQAKTLSNAALDVIAKARAAIAERNAERWTKPLTLTPLTVVEALLGTSAVRLVPAGLLPGYGAVSRLDGRWSVYIAEDAPQTLQQFVMLHELAHVVLGKGASEYQCDALAAELLAECWGRESTQWREAVAIYGEQFDRRGSKTYAAEMARERARVGAP